MSEFEQLLRSKTQDELEAKLWPWTLRLLEKWRTTGLTEQEGQQLLLIWSQVKVTTRAMRFNRLRAAFAKAARLNGLLLAGLTYGKDPRAIRRWCERGYFPGARRTKGGHWRIPPRAVDEARNRLPKGFARRPKNLFSSKAWREFKHDAQRVFYVVPVLALETEATFRNKAQVELEVAARSKASDLNPSGAVFDVLQRAQRKGKLDFARLCARARRLYLDSPGEKMTPHRLARALRIGTATLYRHYTAAEIRAAVRAATRPLNPDEPDAPKTNTDEDTVNQMFDHIELEYQPTPQFRDKHRDQRK